MALLTINLNLQFPCLTTIRDELDVTDFMIQLSIVIGPGLAILSNIFTNFLTTRYGVRRLFITCVLLFSCGSLICALSSNILGFLMGRSLQVLGDAGVSVLGFVVLSNLFSNDLDLGKYFGFNLIFSSLVTIPSPIIGAWVLVHYHWRWNFILLFVLSAILLILFYIYLPEIFQKKKRASAPSFLISLQELWGLFKSPLFFLATVIPALYFCVSSLFDLYSPFFCIDMLGLGPSDFSVFRTGLIFLNVLASTVYIYILKRGGLKTIFNVGLLSYFLYIVILMTFLAFFPLVNNYYNAFLLFCLPAILGISLAFVNPLSMLKVLSCSAGREDSGLAIFALTRNIFSTFFMLIAAFLFNGTIYTVLYIVFFISFLIYFFLVAMKNYMHLHQ
ncbi:MAG: MFS transporter [Alphaproteobacteria bacterium]|nr:MFS transporter [Alphaproteobacteria bacterium]